jgi:hypothetical protein
MQSPAHANPGLVIGLDDRISGLAVLENLRVIDTPDLDVEPVGPGQVDVAVPEGNVPGKKIYVLLGERAECAVAGDDPDPVIDPALSVKPDGGAQRKKAQENRNEGSYRLRHRSSSGAPASRLMPSLIAKTAEDGLFFTNGKNSLIPGRTTTISESGIFDRRVPGLLQFDRLRDKISFTFPPGKVA